jgi:hypothetical protein
MGRVTVFYAKTGNKASGSGSLAGQARDAGVAAARAAAASKAAQVAAGAAQVAANNAKKTAAMAAQSAAAGVSKGVQQGVYGTRAWAAPVMHNAADYTSATLAPKVSAAIHSAADQVSPEDTRKRGRSMLLWSLLAAAVLTGLGAAAAVFRKRYQDAMTVDSEVDAEATATEPGASPADAAKAEADPSAATSTDAGVNGRVSSSGW